MIVGIPRSLFYYYHSDLWISFFNNLKVNYIVSSNTNKEIINLGIKYSQDEMCLSVKNYIGHIAYLKDKCDYILVPRIDNYKKDNQTCTNFLAMYDIINNLFDVKILNYNINLENNENEKKAFIKIGKTLGYKSKDIISAYKKAKIEEKSINKEKLLCNIKEIRSNKLKVLVIGHSYNIHDNLIGKPVIDMLNKYDVDIIYGDYFDKEDNYNKYTKNIYWKYLKKSISSIDHYIDKIDGILFLESFPCGLDSLAVELIIRKINKPYLNIIIDDISTVGGIETRIESFIDIIKVSNRCK